MNMQLRKGKNFPSSIFYFPDYRFYTLSGIFLFSIFYFLFFSLFVHAASSPVLYAVPIAETVRVGDVFSVKILIDSNQPLNAYTVKLEYSSDVLKFASFNNSRSIMDVWQKLPVVSDGVIVFSGGSLKPFSGTGGELLELKFEATGKSAARIAFHGSLVYLANGKGTKVIPIEKGLAFEVGEASASVGEAVSVPQVGEIDDVPPAISFLSVIDNPFQSGQKLLAFNVADENSGVKETSVRFFSFLSWGEWLPARNPTAILGSAWLITFRVVDNYGNVSQRVLYNWRGLMSPPFLALGILIIAFVCALFVIVVRRKLRGKMQEGV